MSNNAPDYENNLAFDPNANSGLHRSYTDRTELTIKLIDQVEKLTKKMIIANTALEVLARSGNEVAKIALEQIKELEK